MRIDLKFRIWVFRFKIIFCSLALCTILSCSQSKTNSDNKFTNYYRQGEQLYTIHCSNCHQSNGAGLGRVYPPLNTSDFMGNNFEKVLCLMKLGVEGELVVNGVSFNQAMPGIPSLTDLEVAQIATYIFNTWTHNRGLIDVKETSRILNQCDNSIAN